MDRIVWSGWLAYFYDDCKRAYYYQYNDYNRNSGQVGVDGCRGLPSRFVTIREMIDELKAVSGRI